MNTIYVVPIGHVDGGMLEAIEVCLWEAYGAAMRRLPEVEVPDHTFDRMREQYGSVPMLQKLLASCPPDAWRLLGVTEVDLFIPMLSFVYGQAQLNGRVALLSLARLYQEFYGLPPDKDTAVERALKEALHEMGHTFGLIHCLDAACPMSLSTTLQQLDRKGASYCPSCYVMLREALKRGAAIGDQRSGRSSN